MQIECTTADAAAQVLFVLIDAHLRPGQEFHMHGPCLPNPPISFTIRVNPLNQVLRRLRGIPGAVIAYQRTA